MILPSENQFRLTESLKSLGLTKYEALVYIALLRVTSATATEIHGSSGVPRASVYPVIDQLLDRDLVSVSQSIPKRFAAVPPEEAIARLRTHVDRDADYALENLSAIHTSRMKAEQGSEELIWNIHGRESIQKKLIDLISGAKKDIRFFAHTRIFSDDIRQALTAVPDKVDVEVITSQWEGPSPENMKIFIKKHPDMPKEMGTAKEMLGGGMCIVDGARVIVIVGSGDADAVALYSESGGFVRFFVRYYNLIIEWAKKR